MTTTGPFDVYDVPEDDDVERVALGALVVPIVDGMEIELQSETEEAPLTRLLVTFDDSGISMEGFSAPIGRGVWEQTRSQIEQSIRSDDPRNSVETVNGPAGAELRAVMVTDADGAEFPQAVRLVGADGPRWLLRGTIMGAAAENDSAAEPFYELFRQTVVIRTRFPIPIGAPLILAPPDDDDHG